MIHRESGRFVLCCDVCGDEAPERFYEFWDAVNYKRPNGWKAQNYNGYWKEVCPRCDNTKHC